MFVLAHLSERLIGELIEWACFGVVVVVIVVVGVHNVQTSSLLKSSPNQTQTSCEVSLGRRGGGGAKAYINYPVHMTKMAARAINSQNN